MIYLLIIFVVAALSAVWGFNRGLARQVPAIIGVAFGIISARLLAPGLVDIIYGAIPSVHGKVEQTFVYDTVSTAGIFVVVYVVFKSVTGFIGKVFDKKEHTILNNIGGAVFGMFRYLLGVAIAFNMWVAIDRDSQLLKYVKSDDGNAVEEIMLLSPALLGGEDVDELSHRIQLEEAKKIS